MASNLDRGLSQYIDMSDMHARHINVIMRRPGCPFFRQLLGLGFGADVLDDVAFDVVLTMFSATNSAKLLDPTTAWNSSGSSCALLVHLRRLPR
jgi:hypothetical protein